MTDNTAYGFHVDDLIYSAHPDPAWARKSWTSLDGVWKLEHRGRVKDITVPFPIGSEASGVDFRDSGTFIYRRTFSLPSYRADRSYLLRVGACDYETLVRVNGREVGRHTGGYASFSFDISAALAAGENSLELVVRDSHSPFQARGKQTPLRKAFFVWYEGISGLWQPIWIEETGRRYLERAETRVDFAARRVEVRAVPSPGSAEGLGLSVEVLSPSGGRRTFVSAQAGANSPAGPGGALTVSFGFDDFDSALWSEADPKLHALGLHLSQDGAELDSVESYFGLRDVKVDREGFRINGEKVYLRMVLDQGYYPGGVYAPRSYRQLEEDIAAIKAMGFNGARIHEKVESPYFHYLCDRLGLYTSFEMPSFYLPSRKAFRAYEGELRELVARDSVHPSCVMRMLFNETWGTWGMYRKSSGTRRFMLAMYDLAKFLDPTRPVIENSGWEHFKTDIADFHHYLKSAALAREVYAGIKAKDARLLYGFSLKAVLDFNFKDQVPTTTRSLFLEKGEDDDSLPLFLSEYGGFGWYHTDNKSAVIESIEEYTKDIVDSGIFCGYCYTQLCDVGAEVNGLFSFDRKPKVDLARLRAANQGRR